MERRQNRRDRRAFAVGSSPSFAGIAPPELTRATAPPQRVPMSKVLPSNDKGHAEGCRRRSRPAPDHLSVSALAGQPSARRHDPRVRGAAHRQQDPRGACRTSTTPISTHRPSIPQPSDRVTASCRGAGAGARSPYSPLGRRKGFRTQPFEGHRRAARRHAAPARARVSHAQGIHDPQDIERRARRRARARGRARRRDDHH